MKYLFLAAGLVGLASCSFQTTPAAPDPTHATVAAYLQQKLVDPTSYQPVRWGVPHWRTRGDSLLGRVAALRVRLADVQLLARADSEALAFASQHPAAPLYQQGPRQRLPRLRQQRDSLRQLLRQVPVRRDTTRLGYYATHTFTSRNQAGTRFADSVRFYVSNRGQLTIKP
jgi:hypothetical protein